MSNEAPPSMSNIDQRMLEIFEKAALGRLVIGPMTRRMATTLRHKLYRFRKKMEQTKHPKADAAASVTIELTQLTTLEPEDHQLILYPTLMHLENALAAAGLTAGSPPPLEDDDENQP